MTEFRDVAGWPGYRVGDDGSVWSCRTHRGNLGATWHRLSVRPNSRGYVTVGLWLGGRSKRVHVARLVLEAFVGPAPEGHESAHWPNNDPSDNRLANLRWATHADNMDDKIKAGTCVRGEAHGGARLTAEIVREIRAECAVGPRGTARALARKYDVTEAAVSLIVKRRKWAHVQ